MWRTPGAFPARTLIFGTGSCTRPVAGWPVRSSSTRRANAGPARARREAQAKAVCFECPAMAACRAHALQVHEPYGIWGGLSEGERAQMLTLAAAAH